MSLKTLNPFERHQLILEKYILGKPNIEKRDIDVIRENHKFIWDDSLPDSELTWREQLARKYYNKLFKEYCICDLSRYKENKVAMRWRTEKEVIAGKGQFVCGNKICILTEELRSWEVNFAYIESGDKKNALVKLRLCPECSQKLNYRSQKREIKRAKKTTRKMKKYKTRDHKTVKSDSESNYERDVSEQTSPNLDKIDHIDESDEQICRKDDKEKVDSENEETSNWKNIPVDESEPSRETEFEKYLEDLLF